MGPQRKHWTGGAKKSIYSPWSTKGPALRAGAGDQRHINPFKRRAWWEGPSLPPMQGKGKGMDPKIAWDTVEKAALALEDCRDPREMTLLEQTLHAAIELFLELDPGVMVEQIEFSPLPTRAAVSWLVFEAGRLSFIDQARVRALAEFWQANCSPQEKLIRPPVLGGNSEPPA